MHGSCPACRQQLALSKAQRRTPPHCLLPHCLTAVCSFHFPPVEPRQLELQLDLSATTYEPCWAVRWEGRHAHPIAAALRTALAVDVGARVKLALPTARVTSLRLVCTDPPKGQIERRLRARLTIAAAHPRWRLPPGAAATLLAALRQDVLRTWAAGTANALPKPVTEKQRGFGLLHLFAYKDPRQAPVCIHGVSLPGLPSCPPDSLRWDPALQATYSVRGRVWRVGMKAGAWPGPAGMHGRFAP